MSENTLDRLDRENNGGARRYVATLIVVGGATNAKVAKALADKFSVAEPTTRSVSKWRNGDAKLIALVDELEAVKRDVSPDDELGDVLAKMPAPVDPAAAVSDLMGVCIRSRPFAELVVAGAHEEVREVLLAEHETDADFDAAAATALAAYVPPDADDSESGGFYG